MEGGRPATYTTTYNNLPGVLAARKLMYGLIPSRAHGEIYDPSHDVWQHTDPVDVIAQTDISRVHRIHVKATRNLKTKARIDWGGMYPMQLVDRKSTRLNSSHYCASRLPSSARKTQIQVNIT